MDDAVEEEGPRRPFSMGHAGRMQRHYAEHCDRSKDKRGRPCAFDAHELSPLGLPLSGGNIEAEAQQARDRVGLSDERRERGLCLRKAPAIDASIDGRTARGKLWPER